MGIEPTTYSLGSCQSDFLMHPMGFITLGWRPHRLLDLCDDLLLYASCWFTLVRTKRIPIASLKAAGMRRDMTECLVISSFARAESSPQPG